MEDDNGDHLKNKEDLHMAGRHTALDIFRFAVFLFKELANMIISISISFAPLSLRAS